MQTVDIDRLAAVADEAARTHTFIDPPDAALSLDDAYRVQEASLALRLARGERLVGMKMGLTSRAKMQQMGVHTPIYGFLTDLMVATDGAILPKSRFGQPRIEPEVCAILGRELVGPVTAVQAEAAVATWCAALEIIDSRYKDFKFSLPAVVADNASSACVVLGGGCDPKTLRQKGHDIACLGMVFEVNGKVVDTASSAAIYDSPSRSLAELANMLAARGQSLKAGQIVMAGGATAAVPLQAGDRVRVRVDGLGSASVRLLEDVKA
jgi:2-oxo-3-hexenedioate decarboxylase